VSEPFPRPLTPPGLILLNISSETQCCHLRLQNWYCWNFGLRNETLWQWRNKECLNVIVRIWGSTCVSFPKPASYRKNYSSLIPACFIHVSHSPSGEAQRSLSSQDCEILESQKLWLFIPGAASQQTFGKQGCIFRREEATHVLWDDFSFMSFPFS
jgi:hypothetical protein